MKLYPDNCHPYTSAAGWLPGRQIAVVDTTKYADLNDYLFTGLNDKSRQHFNKSVRLGYTVTVDHYDYRNERLSDILEINQSKAVRQGREMHDSYNHPYVINRPVYCDHHHFKLLLCLDPTGKIVGYMEFYIVGDFSQTSRVLGHAGHLKNGVMVQLFVEAFRVCREYDCRYFCYGEWFSGGEGLQFFKRSLGFKPDTLMV